MKNLKTLLAISDLLSAGIAQAACHTGAPMAQGSMPMDELKK